jgi:putative oxidoreductase
MHSILSDWAPRMLSVLRIVAALIFLAHGAQKLLGVPPTDHMPAFLSFMWIGGLIELAGGLLLFVGLFTRAAAFVTSGEMAVAYWMFHAPKGVFPTLNGGDAAILYCFVFLYLVFAGPGPWSIDAAWRRAEGTRPRGGQAKQQS